MASKYVQTLNNKLMGRVSECKTPIKAGERYRLLHLGLFCLQWRGENWVMSLESV